MTEPGFHVAAFALDGRLEGISHCVPGELSEQWLGAADGILRRGGEIFDYSWPEELAHIRTKFSSVQGSAIATFLVHGEIAASIFLTHGKDSPAEGQIMAIFAKSLADSDPVKELAGDSKPFERIQEIEERPLMVVVPWMSEGVEERDHALVRELAIHLAAAYFRRPAGTSDEA